MLIIYISDKCGKYRDLFYSTSTYYLAQLESKKHALQTDLYWLSCQQEAQLDTIHQMQCSKIGGLLLGQGLPIDHSGSCRKKWLNLCQRGDRDRGTIDGLLGLWQVIPWWSKSIWNLHGLSFQLTTTLRSTWDLASLSGKKKH